MAIDAGSTFVLPARTPTTRVIQWRWRWARTTTKTVPRWWFKPHDACQVAAAILSNNQGIKPLTCLHDLHERLCYGSVPRPDRGGCPPNWPNRRTVLNGKHSEAPTHSAPGAKKQCLWRRILATGRHPENLAHGRKPL